MHLSRTHELGWLSRAEKQIRANLPRQFIFAQRWILHFAALPTLWSKPALLGRSLANLSVAILEPL